MGQPRGFLGVLLTGTSRDGRHEAERSLRQVVEVDL